jgi:hypothetical protein
VLSDWDNLYSAIVLEGRLGDISEPTKCQYRSGVSDINETKTGDIYSIYVSPTCLVVDLRSIYTQRP